jgi:hypothetical protein
MTAHDWDAIERQYRAGQLSIKELARQHKLSDTAIHKRAKAKGWTRDLSGAVRTRVRESLVCEGVRANLIAGSKPSDADIIDEAAVSGSRWCARTGGISMRCGRPRRGCSASWGRPPNGMRMGS